MSLGQRLMSLPKWALYLILILCTSVPLFFPTTVPNEPQDQAIDLYANLMKLKEGDTVLLASDWTGSTRGESQGEFNSIVRILMRKGVKFAIFSTADPQAPRVAQDAIRRLNEERSADGERVYARWQDWISLGYFANAEAANNGIANDLRGTFGNRTDLAPNGQLSNVFQSPVLQGRERVQDFPMLIVVTGSKTSNITVERVSGKTPLAFAVTGVMGPETNVFYQSNQIVGYAAGLKGLYDLETLMESGINNPGPNGQIVVKSSKYGPVPGFPGQNNKGQGTLYYPTLHFAVSLLILAVIIGNVGMALTRKGVRR